MICTTCDGKGRVPKHPKRLRELAPLLFEERVPCPDCGGTGRMHCCEGLREQPEKRS